MITRIERATATRALSLAAAFDDAPVSFAQEGVGFAGGGVAEDGPEIPVAFAGLAGRGLGAGLNGAGQSFAQEIRCAAVRNRLMSRPDGATVRG